MRNMATVTQMDTPGLGPRKTFLIMVTVVGCIAILWPKVFYPMMFGGGAQKQNIIKEHRGTVHTACCDVVLDRDTFMNVSVAIGEFHYRKRLNLATGEVSLRQERPPHLRPDAIHPALRERGRAIPAANTVPIVERASAPPVVPRVVEGRPGPIPGMRPPLGAGSVHQAQPKGSNMGFIMPLYTVGIVAFFIYTIMKILFKKPLPNAPYGPTRPDPTFRKEVFGQDNNGCCKRPNDGTTKLVVTAIQGLIDATDEEIKRREISAGISKETQDNNQSQNGNISNGHTNNIENIDSHPVSKLDDRKSRKDLKEHSDDFIKHEHNIERSDRKRRETSAERSVKVVNMEMTASCEGGQKWSRPSTPVFMSSHPHSHDSDDDHPAPRAIYLEGSLPHESQILVADSEIRAENVVDEDLDSTPEEPAIVLSSKMTLSLINLSSAEEETDEEDRPADKDSPVDEDMEIINGDEKEKEQETNAQGEDNQESDDE